jgi:cytoskeleton protein RodZ
VVTAISIAIVLAALAAAWGTGALAGLVRAWNGGASAARGGVGTLAANPAASSAQTAAAEAGRAAGGDSLRLVASAETWVEILDGDGRAVLSRTLLAGEALELDAALPLRLTLGNARATEVLLRGQAIDLLPHTRENVARLELR